MTTSRALVIITVATLPLAALTARGFLVNPVSEADTAELETYERGTEEIAAARKVAAEPAVPPADPVGWGLPRKSRPADEPLEYQAAAALAASGRAAAAKGDAIADIAAAVNEIGGLLAETKRAEILALPGGSGLLESLQARRAGLQRHSKWLEDRAEVARRIAALEALLAGQPDGANEKKCLADIAAAVVQFPAVVDDDDPDEQPNTRTKTEARSLEALGARALFRQEYHAAMTAADPDGKLRQLKALLQKYASAPDPQDARLVDDAKQELGVAVLAVLRAQAEQAKTADGMAKALQKWLAAPAAGPDGRKAEAMTVIKTWLARNVPEPPQPADLPSLRDLHEAIVAANGEKRMLGVFEETPNQPGKWRFWQDRKDQLDESFSRGRGDVTVSDPKGPMKDAVFVEIQSKYKHARAAFFQDPLGDGAADAIAKQSVELAERAATHRAIPPNSNALHKLQAAYEALGEELEAACGKAAAAARGFDTAARDYELRSLVLP